MFCRNCGKEIPNGINFCNHCGAAQNISSSQDTQSFYQTNEAQQSTVDSQPMHAEPRPPKKKSKGPLRFIIPIAVVAVAFVIGYFATGANKLKQPTAFAPPTIHDPVDLPSPSINEDAMEDSSEDNIVGAKELAKETFRFSNEIGEAWVTFHYTEDNIVASIVGSITYNDLSLVDTNMLNDLKSDAENAQSYLDELGAGPASSVFVQESPEKFNLTYSFTGLTSDTDMAELAAAFIGFETLGGEIPLETAEAAMTGFGYTLE
ncbi:zinc ribbon domain-containing protein [Lachnospiraceae bacterium OF09-33XD]|nr:zinc ribbon domain-containing protein [Lachnospiraceae bacterium OF09-33XD]